MNFHSYNPIIRSWGPQVVNLNILPGTSGSYVPLFCLKKLPIDQTLDGFFSDRNTASAVHPKLRALFESGGEPFKKNLLSRLINKGYWSNDVKINLMKNEVQLFKEIMEDYVEDTNFNISKRVYNSSVTNNYETMFNYIQNFNYWGVANLRSTNYLLNFGFLSIYKENTIVDRSNRITDHTVDFVPLLSFVVKAENIKYLRLCYLTGKPVDASLLELWVTKGFWERDFEYRLLRRQYLKNMNEFIVKNNIKVVEHDDLVNALFTQIVTPSLKTIKARTEWVEGAKADWIEHLTVTNKLEQSHNIILDYER